MLKRDYFLAAMNAPGNEGGLYGFVPWVISAFSMTLEGPEDYKADPYPYRLVRTPVGMSFCPPTPGGELIKIEDAPVGEPLLRAKERLTIGPNDIPCDIPEGLDTTYGQVIFNYLVIIYAFQKRIPYQVGSISPRAIEKLILKKYADGNPPASQRDPELIYTDDYLKYVEGMYALPSFSQLFTWGVTKKLLLPPPGLEAKKAELLELHKDKLDEMATIAKIDAELVKFDFEYLKGDPGENFLIDKKSRATVRRKLFLMLGAEAGLDDNNVKATLIVNSLTQGWDISKFPDMINSLRAGSYGRSSQTQIGGVSVKWLLRASANMNITIPDCGSRLGGLISVQQKDLKDMVGFSIITKEGSERIKTEEEAGKYLGQTIMMRNPMYCTAEKTDYCQVCVGERLMVNKDGLSIAVASYGSAFLLIYMSAAHSKALQLAELDVYDSLT